MSKNLSLTLTFTESSTEQQRKEIEEKMSELFSNCIQLPTSIACYEGSTVVYLEYVLDAVAVGFLGAVGEYIYSFISEVIKQRKAKNNAGSTGIVNFLPEEKEIKHLFEYISQNSLIEAKSISLPPAIESILKSSQKSEIRFEFTEENEASAVTKGFLLKSDGNRIVQFSKFENIINK